MDFLLFNIIAISVLAAFLIPVIVNTILVVAALALVIWAATEIQGLFYAVVATLSRERDPKTNRAVMPGGAKVSIKMAAEALRYTIKNVN